MVLSATFIDYVFFSGEKRVVEQIIRFIDTQFNLRTMFNRPNKLLFFRLRIKQIDSLESIGYANHEIDPLNVFPIGRARHKDTDNRLSSFE